MSQANTLRQAREAARMSQAHLAAAAGVSKRTVIRAEQGVRIQDENLRCLCSVLGLNVTDLVEPAAFKPRTPLSILREHVAARGEEIRWEGVPDAPAWREEVRYGALLWSYAGLLGATVLSVWLYAEALSLRSDQGYVPFDGWTFLAVLGCILSAYMVVEVSFSLHRVVSRNERLDGTLHVMTEKAFYTARLDDWDRNTVTLVDRIALPEDREGCRIKSRSVVWPMARSIPLRDRSGRRVHVEGIRDLPALARLMRGEPRVTAA